MPSLRWAVERPGGAVYPEILSDRSAASATQANTCQIGRCAAATTVTLTLPIPSIAPFQNFSMLLLPFTIWEPGGNTIELSLYCSTTGTDLPFVEGCRELVSHLLKCSFVLGYRWTSH